jgi:4-hydroxy-tetrahydrodipicolinate synthase
LQRAQAIFDELKPLPEIIVAGGRATTVQAGRERRGVDVGDPRRPLLPLDDGGRAALQKLLTDARSQDRFARYWRSLRFSCVA